MRFVVRFVINLFALKPFQTQMFNLITYQNYG